MSGREIAVLQYPEVASGNGVLLAAAAAARGAELCSVAPHDLQVELAGGRARVLHRGEPLLPAAVLHRTVAPFASLLTAALGVWSAAGVAVLNPAAAAYVSRDKLATALLLQQAGLPVAATTAVDPTGPVPGHRPAVVKPAHGLRGEGVELVRGGVALPAPVSGQHEVYLVQEVIEPVGQDLRAFVVDGRCVALMRRRAAEGEWRANVALGGSATALPLDHAAAALAERAVTACGLDYAGVDLLERADGELIVNEVDAWAGFTAITAVTGTDVAGEIVGLAVRRGGLG